MTGRFGFHNYAVGELKDHYVRIWDLTRPEGEKAPIGMGFLVDPRHIMTCAHVVGDALGDRETWATGRAPVNETIWFEFVCKPADRPSELYKAKVVAAAWRPERGEQPADVAVLEIDSAVVLPPKASVIRTCPKTYVDDRFTALGIKRGLLEGTYVQGSFTGELFDDRIEVVADRVDVAIREGCSGAAVWNLTRRGVAGMIVELQSETQGRVVPIDSLRRLWPGMIEEGDTSAGTETVAGEARLGRRLREVLHTFDRKLQTADFEMALDDYWDTRKSPVVCGILGIQDDLPILCRDRCLRLTFRERLERVELGGKPPIEKKVDWPDPQDRGVPLALARLKQQIKSELKARDSSAVEIRKAYNAGVAPWAFFSFLKQGEFTPQHRELLIQWIGFWREVGAEALNKPLAVLLIFQLEAGSRRGVLLEQVFNEFEKEPFDYVSRLTRLHDFPRDDVMDWLQEQAAELAISSDDLNDKLVPDARKNLDGTSTLRLSALENWVQNLQI